MCLSVIFHSNSPLIELDGAAGWLVWWLASDGAHVTWKTKTQKLCWKASMSRWNVWDENLPGAQPSKAALNEQATPSQSTSISASTRRKEGGTKSAKPYRLDTIFSFLRWICATVLVRDLFIGLAVTLLIWLQRERNNTMPIWKRCNLPTLHNLPLNDGRALHI